MKLEKDKKRIFSLRWIFQLEIIGYSGLMRSTNSAVATHLWVLLHQITFSFLLLLLIYSKIPYFANKSSTYKDSRSFIIVLSHSYLFFKRYFSLFSLALPVMPATPWWTISFRKQKVLYFRVLRIKKDPALASLKALMQGLFIYVGGLAILPFDE